MVAFTDNFTPDAAALSASWASRAGTFKILSGIAAPTTTGAYTCSSVVTPFDTNNHKSVGVIGGTPSTSDYIIQYIRANNAQQIIGFLVPGSAPQIYTGAGTYASLSATPRATGASPLTPVAGGQFSLEAVGDTITWKYNGASVVSWTDTGAALYPYVDSSHRESAMGYMSPNAGVGWDSWSMAEIGSSGVSSTNFFELF